MNATTHQKSPAALVCAARRGEQRAWNALVRRYTPLVRSVAADHRLQSHDADDVVQSCWLALLESLPTLREPEAVGAWLVTAARRQSLRTRGRLQRDVLVEMVLRRGPRWARLHREGGGRGGACPRAHRGGPAPADPAAPPARGLDQRTPSRATRRCRGGSGCLGARSARRAPAASSERLRRDARLQAAVAA